MVQLLSQLTTVFCPWFLPDWWQNLQQSWAVMPTLGGWREEISFLFPQLNEALSCSALLFVIDFSFVLRNTVYFGRSILSYLLSENLPLWSIFTQMLFTHFRIDTDRSQWKRNTLGLDQACKITTLVKFLPGT